MESQPEHATPGSDGDSAGSPGATGPDALYEAVQRVAEAREDLVYMAGVEFDRFKLKFRRVIIWIIVAVAVVFLFLAVLISATALLLWGLADLIGTAFGGRTWVGALVVGGGILVLASGSMYGGIWGWNRSAFNFVKRRYELRKQRQRRRYGHSIDPVDDRAA